MHCTRYSYTFSVAKSEEKILHERHGKIRENYIKNDIRN
jgi:hypothetical protein